MHPTFAALTLNPSPRAGEGSPAEVGVAKVSLAQVNTPEVQTPQGLTPEVDADEVAIAAASPGLVSLRYN